MLNTVNCTSELFATMSSGQNNSINLRPSQLIITRPQSEEQQSNKSEKKRGRTGSNSSSPESNQLMKKVAMGIDEPLSQSTLENLFKSQTENLKAFITNEIKSHCDALSANLGEKIDSINKRVDQIEANVNNQITALNQRVDSCIQHNLQNDDDIIRLTKLNELKISGIDYEKSGDLKQIFGSIAGVIGFDSSTELNVPSLYRIYKKPNTGRAPNPSNPLNIIIMRFISKHIRDEFYSKYLEKIANNNPITTTTIGLQGDDKPIRITENLTTSNARIFGAAIAAKKRGKLSKVMTQNGIVYAKSTLNEKKSALRSNRDLDILLAHVEQMENESTNQSSSTQQTNVPA